MENHKLVLPEQLNHYGYLMGGHLLKWVDEYAWIAASLDFPRANFVTIALDKVLFKKSVRQGTILKFLVDKTGQGRTSATYGVEVWANGKGVADSELIFTTRVTFVSIGADGEKVPLPELEDLRE